VTDFRSARMESPEGKGRARRAWDAYAGAVEKVSRPVVEPFARKAAVPVMMDLAGFWLLWHAEGGFEGLQRLGMSRSSIYRRISLFRKLMGVHPDEYEMPGVKLNVAKYQTTPAAPGAAEEVKSS
jgi:hypothetical protein